VALGDDVALVLGRGGERGGNDNVLLDGAIDRVDRGVLRVSVFAESIASTLSDSYSPCGGSHGYRRP
jgi:hypothetical protein